MTTQSKRSPVREFYERLVEMFSAEDIEFNLEYSCEDYKEMVGPPDARFCEWVYTRLEQRALVEGLMESMMRPADPAKFANHIGVDAQKIADLSPEMCLRVSLSELGIEEPRLPEEVENGVQELRDFQESFELAEAGQTVDIEKRDRSPEAQVAYARRGAERLLKIMARFLWDVGCDDILEATVRQELHGFQNPGVPLDERGAWLREYDLGTLNYLLYAADRERRERQRALPFLRGRDEFWGEPVFQRFRALAGALSKEFHEGTPVEKRRPRQRGAVGKVLDAIDGDMIRIPEPVRFFRRFEDGLGSHFEGFTAGPSPERITFYEMQGASLELHSTYLFLSATNPSALDAACTELVDGFTRPV